MTGRRDRPTAAGAHPAHRRPRRTAEHVLVYGGRCSWWDSIRNAAQTQARQPCCPFCGGPVFEVREEDWWSVVDGHESELYPAYREFVEWMRGRPCFPNYSVAWLSYLAGR